MATPGRKCGRSRSRRQHQLLHHLLRRQRQRAPCNHPVVRHPRQRRLVRRRHRVTVDKVEALAGAPVVAAQVAVVAQAADLAVVALPEEDAAAARRRRSAA